MARRKDMLTEKKNPLSLGVYKVLGAFFIALLEARWKRNILIYEDFFSVIRVNKKRECDGTDRTWRRWKSLGINNQPFLGSRPELVLDAIEWARTCENMGSVLITDDEACQISESFSTLLYWDDISKNVDEEFQRRVHKIIDTVFELAGFEFNENPYGYKDKITGEIFEYLSPIGYSMDFPEFSRHLIMSKLNWRVINERYKIYS